MRILFHPAWFILISVSNLWIGFHFRAVIAKVLQMFVCYLWRLALQIRSQVIAQLLLWSCLEEHWHQDPTMHQAFPSYSFLKHLLLSIEECSVSTQWQRLVNFFQLFKPKSESVIGMINKQGIEHFSLPVAFGIY